MCEGLRLMFNDPLMRDLAVYGLIALILLIGLVILMKIVRGVVGSRVQSLKMESMTFEDLGHMQQTGLLTEEEYRLIKKRMAKKMLQQSIDPAKPEEKPKGEAALRSLLVEIEQLGPQAIVQKDPPVEPAPVTPDEPVPAPPAESTSSPHPRLGPSAADKQLLDLEKLLVSAAIDEAEYKRLRDYFLKKQQQ